jgi:S1-C subfamily serine protease
MEFLPPRQSSVSFATRLILFLAVLPLVALVALGASGLAVVLLDDACPTVLRGTPLCDIPPVGEAPGLLSGDVRALADGIQPSVVMVAASDGGFFERTTSVGTGLIIRQDGLVLTANHVIKGAETDRPRLSVTLSNGDRLEARLIGHDAEADTALLKIEAEGLQPAYLQTDLDQVSRGDPVVAVGSPSLLSQPVLSGTVVTLRSRVIIPEIPRLHHLMETTVPLVQGTSGSPLVSSSGAVVGLNVAGMFDPDTGERYGGLAVPSDTLIQVVDRLLAHAGGLVSAGAEARAASF